MVVNDTTGPRPPMYLMLKVSQPAQSTLLVAVTVDGKIVFVGPRMNCLKRVRVDVHGMSVLWYLLVGGN